MSDPTAGYGDFSNFMTPSMPVGQWGSNANAPSGMSAAQKQMLAKALMNFHPQQQQMPMLNLGQVNGILPGGGVQSPYGVV